MTSCGRVVCVTAEPALGGVMFPKISATAGPALTVSFAPSIPLGMAGRFLPALAAAPAVLSLLKVKTATAFGVAAYVTVVEIVLGSLATGGFRAAIAFAAAALLTICQF